jgi:prepilin-type N-terminal cleavage/methylation domain-containing protein
MRKVKYAFTMIELIFVIVIIGILSKFGVEFLAQAYNSFIFSSINNSLQSRSAMAVETIASRLQFRIKDSIIARQNAATFAALGGSTLAENATTLEWVGVDVEGLRGLNTPLWSGIIDLDPSTATSLNTPLTDTATISSYIDALSNSGSDINDSAIYFIGSDSDIQSGYGWDGNAILTQGETMHPIRDGGANTFVPINGNTGADNNFTNVDVYEYYQLAWTAYAVALEDFDGDGNSNELVFYYDYQPWQGESYTSGKSALLMENVDTFRFKAVGSVVKIQVCVNSSVVEDYSLCKEKTIF